MIRLTLAMPQSTYHLTRFELVVVVARVAPVADVSTVVIVVVVDDVVVVVVEPSLGSLMHIFNGRLAGISSGGALSHVSGHKITLSGYGQQRL